MSQSPYSFDSFMSFVRQNFGVLVLLVVGFGGGFYIGSLWTENQVLRSGGSGAAAAPSIAGVGDTGAAPAAAPTGPEGPTKEQLAAMPAVSADDHIKGSPDADVILVEYSDFECPFCARFHPTVQNIVDEYDGQVAWVYRHYPLSFHPQARPAAIASECVAQLYGNDAFWQYGDALFELTNAGGLSSAALIDAVADIGYDSAAVETCLDNEETASIVDDHFSTGSAAGVSGTPGTIIVTADGPQELIPGALPEDAVKSLIDQYL